MIELRWKSKQRAMKVADEKYGGGVRDVLVTDRVLQYRSKTAHVDSPTTKPIDPIWSEWQNVPEVFVDC